jgi:hypothetical protein
MENVVEIDDGDYIIKVMPINKTKARESGIVHYTIGYKAAVIHKAILNKASYVTSQCPTASIAERLAHAWIRVQKEEGSITINTGANNEKG